MLNNLFRITKFIILYPLYLYYNSKIIKGNDIYTLVDFKEILNDKYNENTKFEDRIQKHWRKKYNQKIINRLNQLASKGGEIYG